MSLYLTDDAEQMDVIILIIFLQNHLSHCLNLLILFCLFFQLFPVIFRHK